MEQRTLRDYFFILLRGMAMGAADIVPGVSGGTIALITGVYEELLRSLKQLTPAALLVLFKQGVPAFWRHINGNFLLALFGGVLLSLKTLAAGVSWCLEHEPLLVWGGFSGLIAASLYVLARDQARWGAAQLLLFVLGAALVVAIALAKPAQAPAEWWMLFLGGFIAICAMILPGISGSFLLLLMGLYPVFLAAIDQLDLLALASFGVGCIAGLLVFSRFLSWLLARWYTNTLAVMLGFLAGSLYVTWPWKIVTETMIDRHGEVVSLMQQNTLPGTFAQLSGESAQLGAVIFCAFVGALLVLSIDFLSKRMDAESEGSYQNLKKKSDFSSN